ncbi:transporter [Sulfurovum sp.]|uniref:transporter n=1 Tax=Sulfurovum sp. TaxID=1969726 RepID=UPI0035640F7A
MNMVKNSRWSIALSMLLIPMTTSFASDQNTELAKKLANPIASLISVPIQYNYDSDIGLLDTGSKSFVNIQPVIPISLNDDWNVISRTILPIVWQDDIIAGSGSQSGLGNVTQSLFFSPKLPTEDGWIWGVGPVFLVPTATNDLIGGDQWGAGPTGVALKQSGQWTYGALFNHVWSFADDKNHEISSTFLQPFLSHVTDKAVTYALNTESSYNWKTEEWSVPINATVTKVMKWGDQLVSVGGGVRYWAVSDSDFTPEGWGVRIQCTFLFPK